MKPIFLKPKLHTARRGWWGFRALRIVALLALVAVCVWLLMSCQVDREASPPVGILTGLGAFGISAVLFMLCVVRRVDDGDEEEVGELVDDTLALPPGSVSPEDLGRIVCAMRIETEAACECVRRAQEDLSVEDYGVKLAAAEANLQRVVACMTGLTRRLGTDPQIFAEEETAHS